MTKDEAEALLARYTTRVDVIDNRPRGWNYLDIEILLDGERVGSYRRNYPDLYDTFVPFVQVDGDGDFRVLALYSPHYTATRVMRLPECLDLCGEEPAGRGFCPTGFYVPYDLERGLTGAFGFVSGCVWGDDSSWKVQYLDLSRAAEGKLKRDERFGYVALPKGVSLRDGVNMKQYRSSDPYGFIEFTMTRTYSLTQDRFPDPFE